MQEGHAIIDRLQLSGAEGLLDPACVSLCVCAHTCACVCRSQFKQGKSAQAVAHSLVEIAVKRYTTDNVAVIVADLKGQPAWTARPKSNRKGLLSGLFSSSKE